MTFQIFHQLITDVVIFVVICTSIISQVAIYRANVGLKCKPFFKFVYNKPIRYGFVSKFTINDQESRNKMSHLVLLTVENRQYKAYS